jgi:hypothetical protein
MTETLDATVEAALLYLAGRCDGANSEDGQRFNKLDAIFGKAMAEKVKSGKLLTEEEYKDACIMLKKYNKQLVEGGMDYRLIPKERPPQSVDVSKMPEEEEPIPPEIEAAARQSLEHGDPVKDRTEYAETQIHGAEHVVEALTYSEFSSYMKREYRQHCDVSGSSQAGKTFTAMLVMDTFPEKDRILFTNVTPKFFYYWASQMGDRLEYFYIYLDDTRDEHIPILIVFRNDPVVKPSHGTVSEQEAMLMTVEYRPVLNSSSVSPLQDHEG